MNKSKIEWTDYSWNPTRGLCPVDCKLPDGRSYCYARRMYQRFGWNPRLGFNSDELWQPSGIKKPSCIFVCSTFELFHSSTDEEVHIERDPVSEDAFFGKSFRDWIFHVIEDNPQHTFQILTKFPQNIDRPMPDNVWLGVSVTNHADAFERIPILLNDVEARVRFVSIEPILGEVNLRGGSYGPDWLEGWDVESEHDSNCDGSCVHCPVAVQYQTNKLDWIIVGKLTGHGNKYNPKRELIENIVRDIKNTKTPIFLKNNLKSIWGENLIQEFPE